MISKSSVGDSSELVWFKSSHSDSGNSNECVEVATTPLSVLVRDSKAPRKISISVSPAAWSAFVAAW
ncbi:MULTISPECIES: DUF397 domain-containing protein [unclassified Streptomyces]|uniref:DUF397 domain-containing protein n=1 Tax=unclassified Streptomyces TaxID=2593676 RepID=UPI002257815B|nr:MULTISPECIES: DUF397 domain-containing protein [unclassified Streptomyces]MCX5437638.1 DUF397 domain-containing protein [Streptomyces sp. NBC_00063]WSE15323.1 DUF397 domain-containing protein [Streptomyces sp. NBC_01397]WUB95765.1 DUF397 domain-containing protein [Streptomyces sp. NBC_00569]